MHRLVEQHLPDRRGLQAVRDDALELLLAARDPAAAPAEREGGAHDARQAQLGERRARLLAGSSRSRSGASAAPRAAIALAEQVAVLGARDRVVVGADQLDAEALQGAVVVQRLGEVQRGLPAERAEQRVGALALDHLRHRAGQQRLDVRRVGELGVGHDRGGVGVDEHHLVALLAQHLAGLHAGVVELGGLPDHDRPGAEDQDLVDVSRRGIYAALPIRSRKRSNRYRLSCGPGPASGWYCTVPPGTSSSSRPSTVRS